MPFAKIAKGTPAYFRARTWALCGIGGIRVKSDILEISLAILAAALAAWLALITYFRQKEYELILERYLVGSIDLLASDLQGIAAVFAHNWTRCLAIIKSYRDTGDEFDIAELTTGFLDMNASNPNIVAHYRLHRLVGTMDYWNYYLAAIAFYATANSVLTKEIPETIRRRMTGSQISNAHAEIAEAAFRVASEQDADSHKYIRLVSEFQDLATALEGEKFTFKKVRSFKSKDCVRQSIGRVEQTVKDLQNQNA
jgi:hypothetical protein